MYVHPIHSPHVPQNPSRFAMLSTRRPRRLLSRMIFSLATLYGFLSLDPEPALGPLAGEDASQANTPKPNLPNPTAVEGKPTAGAQRLPDHSKILPRLFPLEGSPVDALLKSAGDGKFIFQSASGETISLSAESLVRWGSPREFERGPVVVLADGSLLVAPVRGITPPLVRLEPDLITPQKAEHDTFPVGEVVGVLLGLPAELGERDRWLDRLQKQTTEEDRLFLINGDELVGRIEGGDEKAVRFAGPLGPMRLELARIRAVQFRRIPRPIGGPDGLQFWVGLRDGTFLLAEKITVQDTSAQLTRPGGLVFETEAEHLVFIQPVGARVVYLSDLQPKQYRFEPFFELRWPYGRDRCVAGSWLRSRGQRYLKGLGVHSAAVLKYDLAGRYNWCEAELALDDSTGARGCVVFRILVDGRLLYKSEPISGGDPPVSIRLDMTQAQELELVVDYGPWGDEMDRANWLDARLISAIPSAPKPSNQKSPPATAPDQPSAKSNEKTLPPGE